MSAESNAVVYVVIGFGEPNDRVAKLLTLRRWYSRLVLVRPGRSSQDADTLVVRPIPNPTILLSRLGASKIKKMVDRWLFFPSAKILFALRLQRALGKQVRRDLQQGKDVRLLTCVPPHDLCVAGLSLKKRYPRIFWAVDWQDLWTHDENYLDRVPRAYHAKLYELEQQVLKASDLNITTNSRAKVVLQNEYGVPRERVVAIPHHFSPEDLYDAERCGGARGGHGGPIALGFLGSLFKPPRVPGAWLAKTLRDLRSAGLDVRLHVHGRPPALSHSVLTRMEAAGMVFHGSASHEQSLQRMLCYDFLLILLNDLPNCRSVMSIKLPHYLHLGRPIIAIVPRESAIADVIRETGAGFVVPVNSDWSKELGRLLKNAQRGNLPQRDVAKISAYSWASVAPRWREALSNETQAR